ncbi:MAG: ferritin family protein [Chloroflexota bacterium]|nr:ferritin family protein [Chloroflexota bacterium]
MTFLKATDVVELAMQLEKSGEAFYRAVAQKTESPQIRSLFEDLADQEVKHYAVFAELSHKVRAKPLMTDDEWDQYMAYLNATVQSAFFEGPDKALAAAEVVMDEKEAVRMAVGFEKETLLFFYDLRDAVPAADRPFIEKVVAEEKSHIRRLAGML